MDLYPQPLYHHIGLQLNTAGNNLLLSLNLLQTVGTAGLSGTSISSALLISAASLFYPAHLADRKALQPAALCAKPKSRWSAAARRVAVCIKKSASVPNPDPESLKTFKDEQDSCCLAVQKIKLCLGKGLCE